MKVFDSPLVLDCKNKVWLVGSVYVMIEVKAKVINAELKIYYLLWGMMEVYLKH